MKYTHGVSLRPRHRSPRQHRRTPSTYPWTKTRFPHDEFRSTAQVCCSIAHVVMCFLDNMATQSTVELMQQLISGLDALQADYIQLFEQHTALEHKLTHAREQVSIVQPYCITMKTHLALDQESVQQMLTDIDYHHELTSLRNPHFSSRSPSQHVHC